MSELGWELPESASLADLLREIRGAYPDLAPPDVEIVAAVNEDYAEGGVVLREGDEVALIPPVSGGGEDEGSLSSRQQAQDRRNFPVLRSKK